jgi:CBS domain-containing protein
MQIGQCCNRTVAVARPHTAVTEAARMMRELHVGTIVVVQDGNGINEPVGLVTDRDLVVEVLADDVDPDTVALADIMSDGISTAGVDDELFDTLERMRELGIRRMPVVEASGNLVGIVSMDDILALFSEGMNDITQLIRREVTEEAVTRN